MREGWTYKKLGEVGDVITGSTPSTKDKDNYNSNDVCFVKPSDIPKEGIGLLSDSEFYISNKAFSNSRKLPKGSVLTTCIGIIGKVGILQVDATCNQQINAIIPYSCVSSSFLAYTILSKRHYLENIANAPVVPIINKKDFSNTVIHVPPLAEQERIVAELDLLSSIIEKKKAQLSEYDQLAQSIFYDMFGTTNIEKGWEVKKLGEVGVFQRGGGFLKSDFVDNGFPCIHYGQIHTRFGAFTYTHLTSITEDLAKSKSKIAKQGDVIIAITSEDVEGSCKCVAWLGDYDVAVGAHAAIFRHNLNPIYLSYYFKSEEYNTAKTRYARGFKVVEIKPDDIAKIDIPLPPLSLQQEFAERIEAIEKQKALVQASIVETETLFNSRMDYYFN